MTHPRKPISLILPSFRTLPLETKNIPLWSQTTQQWIYQSVCDPSMDGEDWLCLCLPVRTVIYATKGNRHWPWMNEWMNEWMLVVCFVTVYRTHFIRIPLLLDARFTIGKPNSFSHSFFIHSFIHLPIYGSPIHAAIGCLFWGCGRQTDGWIDICLPVTLVWGASGQDDETLDTEAWPTSSTITIVLYF